MTLLVWICLLFENISARNVSRHLLTVTANYLCQEYTLCFIMERMDFEDN
jgi:hypothetical protein